MSVRIGEETERNERERNSSFRSFASVKSLPLPRLPCTPFRRPSLLSGTGQSANNPRQIGAILCIANAGVPAGPAAARIFPPFEKRVTIGKGNVGPTAFVTVPRNHPPEIGLLFFHKERTAGDALFFLIHECENAIGAPNFCGFDNDVGIQVMAGVFIPPAVEEDAQGHVERARCRPASIRPDRAVGGTTIDALAASVRKQRALADSDGRAVSEGTA